ncbi:hypothetical protein MMC31_001445 [Peltigera leucophlebia]|nr:hypothetical protein [Peltigera leucophlebia]
MAVLFAGNTLDWPSAQAAADQIRKRGIEQLIALWQKYKDRDDDVFLWGDETEGLLVIFDDERRHVEPLLQAKDVLERLNSKEAHSKNADGTRPRPGFHPEVGSFMLEVIPGRPWGISPDDILDVESNMAWRRVLVREQLKLDQSFITLGTFPGLGSKVDPSQPPFPYPSTGKVSRSQFVGDEVINKHPRYSTIFENIRRRRGRKIAINVPIFRDDKTTWPFHDPTINYNLHDWPEDDDVRNGAAKENHIYMDSSIYGSGCCSLQVTVQAKNINEARRLYDQLLQLSPIMLALTAATPITKGFLADTDVRTSFHSQSADDRTPEELGEKPITQPGQFLIPKSRCASNSTYISLDPRLKPSYVNPDLVINKSAKSALLAAGMDNLLANHFAHLFIRDPLLLYDHDLYPPDTASQNTNSFEIFQSTNWQEVRFKPPPSLFSEDTHNNTGWRVEFRSMEVQPTDFENAACAIFIVLFVRTLLHLDLSLYIPIKKLDENMATAHSRDAVLNGKFHWRYNVFPSSSPTASTPHTPANAAAAAAAKEEEENEGDELSLLTIDEIINGSSIKEFPGLIPLIQIYLSANTQTYPAPAIAKIKDYLSLVSKRASGQIPTTARSIRNFVHSQEGYHRDSRVSGEVLWKLLRDIGKWKVSGGEEGYQGEHLNAEG